MKKKVLFLIKYLIIGLIALSVLIPFWDMFINSFKTATEAAVPNIGLPSEWQGGENYRTVIEKGKLIQAFKNSLIITVSSTLIILIISTMGAYVFGRRKEKSIRIIFFIFLMGIMTPPSMILTVILLQYLNLLGTYLGIILFYSATFCPLPIFLLTGFMTTISKEIEESAIIDGASPIMVFFKITLPLLKPAIAVSFIWTFLKIWNDFLYPLYVLSGNTSKYTMTLSLFFFRGQFLTQWNLVFAHLALVGLPVLVVFIFAQRHIAEGMTAGAVKG